MPDRLSLRMAILLFAALIAVGTLGYMLTEGWSPGHALYASVTTLSTLGIEHPSTPAGMAFTVVFVLVGVATSLYILGVLVTFVAEGHFSQGIRRQRMERRIAQLHDHHIICGFGRVGRQIVAAFEREGMPFVLIDINPASLTEAEGQGHLVIPGSPVTDEVLGQARLETARGLIAATDNDAENLYVTLAARSLRSDLFIVARANHPDAEAKLQRAGADRVISPYSLGGMRMAMLALRPLSVEFVDTVLRNKEGDVLLEDVQIRPGSPLVGLTLAEARRRYMPEVTVLVLRAGERVIVTPGPEAALADGDALAVLGTAPQLAALERAASAGGGDAARG